MYVIDPEGNSWRLGFALDKEHSNHALGKTIFLNLARSKHRSSSFGSELLLGD